VLSFDKLKMNGNLLVFIETVRTELVEVQFLEITSIMLSTLSSINKTDDFGAQFYQANIS